MGMHRRDCDCSNVFGDCLRIGEGSCVVSDAEKGIITWNPIGEWTLVSKRDGTSKTLSNARSYCLQISLQSSLDKSSPQ